MANWRNTFKPARFFLFDAKLSVVLLFFLLHIRLWTLILASVVMFIFWILERKGLDTESAVRGLRNYFVGDKRPPVSEDKIRWRIDYGNPVTWKTIKDNPYIPIQLNDFDLSEKSFIKKIKITNIDISTGFMFLNGKIIENGQIVSLNAIKSGKLVFIPYETLSGTYSMSFNYSLFKDGEWTEEKENKKAETEKDVLYFSKSEKGFLEKHLFNIAVFGLVIFMCLAGYVMFFK